MRPLSSSFVLVLLPTKDTGKMDAVVDQLCLGTFHTLKDSFPGCPKCSTVSLWQLHRWCFHISSYPTTKFVVGGKVVSYLQTSYHRVADRHCRPEDEWSCLFSHLLVMWRPLPDLWLPDLCPLRFLHSCAFLRIFHISGTQIFSWNSGNFVCQGWWDWNSQPAPTPGTVQNVLQDFRRGRHALDGLSTCHLETLLTGSALRVGGGLPRNLPLILLPAAPSY